MIRLLYTKLPFYLLNKFEGNLGNGVYFFDFFVQEFILEVLCDYIVCLKTDKKSMGI